MATPSDSVPHYVYYDAMDSEGNEQLQHPVAHQSRGSRGQCCYQEPTRERCPAPAAIFVPVLDETPRSEVRAGQVGCWWCFDHGAQVLEVAWLGPIAAQKEEQWREDVATAEATLAKRDEEKLERMAEFVTIKRELESYERKALMEEMAHRLAEDQAAGERRREQESERSVELLRNKWQKARH